MKIGSGLLGILCATLAACGSGGNTTGGSGGSIGSTNTTGGSTSSSTSSTSGTTTHGTTTGTHGATTAAHATTGSTTSSGHETTGASSTGATTSHPVTSGATSSGAASTGSSGHGTTGTTTAGAGTSTTSTTGASTTGGSTGTTGGLSDGGCAAPYDPTIGCAFDSDCGGCGLVCVSDIAFYDETSGTPDTVCEPSCTSNAGCSNAATLCTANAGHVDSSTGDTCTVNLCADGGSATPVPGASCDATGNGSQSGTCVPQSFSGQLGYDNDQDFLICVLSGTAKSCGSGTTSIANDDDPYYTENVISDGVSSGRPTILAIPASFPRTASALCSAGTACDYAWDGGPTCESLCVPDGNGGAAGCTGTGIFCLGSDPTDTTWGFCGPCAPSGGPCALNPDCCSFSSVGGGACNLDFGGNIATGTCQ